MVEQKKEIGLTKRQNLPPNKVKQTNTQSKLIGKPIKTDRQEKKKTGSCLPKNIRNDTRRKPIYDRPQKHLTCPRLDFLCFLSRVKQLGLPFNLFIDSVTRGGQRE